MIKTKPTIYLLSLFLSSSLFAGAEIFNFMNNLDVEFMMDKSEATLDLCHCDIANGGKGAGLKMRLAEPIGVQETTNSPWKLVALDVSMEKGSKRQGQGRNNGNNKRYSHYYSFAPFSFLNLIQDSVCFERFTSLGSLYFSEIIPTQNSDVLAGMIQIGRGPLGKAWYNNPLAILLALPDCAATTFYEPMNSVIFNAGCAGLMANNTAYGNMKDSDPIMESHVLGAEMLDDLYYSSLLSKTSNASFAISPTSAIPNSMCGPKFFPTIVKTENYFQLFMPTVWSAQKIGMFRTFHADFKNKPGSGDDTASWVWRIKDFCAGGAKCQSLYPEGMK